jgi:hypothetical protein
MRDELMENYLRLAAAIVEVMERDWGVMRKAEERLEKKKLNKYDPLGGYMTTLYTKALTNLKADMHLSISLDFDDFKRKMTLLNDYPEYIIDVFRNQQKRDLQFFDTGFTYFDCDPEMMRTIFLRKNDKDGRYRRWEKEQAGKTKKRGSK